MKIQIWSSSVIGKLANIFSLIFVILIALKLMAIRLPLSTPVITVFGLVGLLLGLITFFKNKDRSILTILSIVVGIVIVLWTAGEFLL